MFDINQEKNLVGPFEQQPVLIRTSKLTWSPASSGSAPKDCLDPWACRLCVPFALGAFVCGIEAHNVVLWTLPLCYLLCTVHVFRLVVLGACSRCHLSLLRCDFVQALPAHSVALDSLLFVVAGLPASGGTSTLLAQSPDPRPYVVSNGKSRIQTLLSTREVARKQKKK